MTKYFHKIMGVSVLPALLVMPAMAYEVATDTNLNEVFPNGTLSEILRSENGAVGILTTDNIAITGTESDNVYLVRVSNAGSVLNLGTSDTLLDSIEIHHVGDNTRAVTVWDDGAINLYADNINISAAAQGLTVWGNYDEGKTGTATVVGTNIDIDAANAVYLNEGTTATIRGGNINISGDDGISVWGKLVGSQYVAGGQADIKTLNLDVDVTGTGIGANYGKSQISIVADGDVTVSAYGSDDTRALHAGNATTNPDIAKEDTSFVSITAKNINLNADKIGISAMSNGRVDLDGNVSINAHDAILARGYSTVNINESGKNKVKMNGNVNFDYYSKNSGSLINAFVNVKLVGDESYWAGNTVASYLYENEPGEEKMKVDSFNLSLIDGAVWNATQIEDTSRTFEEEDSKGVMHTYSEGEYYIALNNLNINKGIVNIKDTNRGITVDNANIADATFNGGILNFKNMTLTGGTNTFNNNVAGVDDASVLTVDSGAIMNIGTNNIDVNTIKLNGDMLATLRSGDTAQITAKTFDGTGTLKLTMREEGTYKVFGDAEFSNIAWDENGVKASSPIYNLIWNNGDVTASRKTIAEVAKDNNLTGETASVVSNLTDSSSDKLNELAEKMQEKLAAGTDADKAEVEHAAAAVHPEKESVIQSVSTSVQNTVVNLASARMAAPMVGRSAGDVQLTSGGIWAQGIFNKSKQDNAFHGYTRGIAAGVDGTFDKHLTLGAGYSYAHSDVNGSVRDTEIDSSTVFVYGQYKPTQWYMNAIASYTMSDYSESGMALGTPVVADYDVDSYGVSVASGYDFTSGITPELGLRYIHINADDYVNSTGVKTSLKDNDFMTAVFGTKYAFNIVADKYTTFVPQLNAAVKYDLLSDDHVATVTIPGIDTYSLEGKRLSRIGGEFGIGLGMKHRNIDFSVNYDIDVREGYTSQTGMVKFRCNF